jgi:hypothetical protein
MCWKKIKPTIPGSRAYSVSCTTALQFYSGETYIGSSVDLGNRLGQYHLPQGGGTALRPVLYGKIPRKNT